MKTYITICKNRNPKENCCACQETQIAQGVGWGGRREGDSKGRGYMYTYGCFTLRFDRKQQNSVKQLSFS